MVSYYEHAVEIQFFWTIDLYICCRLKNVNYHGDGEFSKNYEQFNINFVYSFMYCMYCTRTL
jgi:hypothetical protein